MADAAELDGDEALKKVPKKGMSGMTIAVIVLAVLLLVAVSMGATLFFTGALSGGGKEVASDAAAEHGSVEGEASKSDPIFYKLDPPFVVNFNSEGKARYLQVMMEVMARDQSAIDDVEVYTPVIRNNLVLLLSTQDYATVNSREGKQKIREEVLAEIQAILEEQTGEPGIEQVYFTSFVMQ
ncbi:MAG: flagellar basal body protein FliL [Gammaproteobacteria bacterium]|nr:flagellar basal body protein FliL [Gammaproteobacteria bacterium]